MTTPQESGERQLKPLDLLNFVTQDVRAHLVQYIIGHPKESPSLDELSYMLENHAKTTVNEHLEKLVDRGVVERAEREKAGRDEPRVFYTLSDMGWDLLEDYNVFVDQVEEIKSDYAAVEKPARILRHEQAPRPWDDDGDVVDVNPTRHGHRPRTGPASPQ